MDYEPSREQLAILDVDLPLLLPSLVIMAEQLGLETGVRLIEPPAPTIVEGEARISDGSIVGIEHARDLAKARARYREALSIESRAVQIRDIAELLGE